MRAARSRVMIFRAILLAVLAGVLVWRAIGARRLAAAGVEDAGLLERLALLEVLLAAVALLAAGLALLSLRSRSGPPPFTLRRPGGPRAR